MKIDKLAVPVFTTGSLFEPVDIKSASEEKSFGEMLSAAISDVDGLQKVSAQKNIDLAAGRLEDVSEVMIAAEKASVALQLTVQVRNKVVEAYQEMMRMQM